MELPKRKPTRLKNYNYNNQGAYFVTICTHNRKNILSNIVGDGVYDIPQINLSEYGKIIEKYLFIMNSKYDNVFIDKYIIMPNHIHMIIKITKSLESGLSQAPNPTNSIIPKFISLFKRFVNKEIGYNIFQRSFYDHIIRDEEDYLRICEYIETNPLKREEDEFYNE